MKTIEISLPKVCVPYEQDFRRFVDAMIYKMAKNAHKGRWEEEKLKDLIPKLEWEVGELREASKGGNTVEVLLECADVANFAMMISSKKLEASDA